MSSMMKTLGNPTVETVSLWLSSLRKTRKGTLPYWYRLLDRSSLMEVLITIWSIEPRVSRAYLAWWPDL